MDVGLEIRAVEFGFHLVSFVVLGPAEYHLDQFRVEIRKKSPDGLTANARAALMIPQHVGEFMGDDVILVSQRGSQIEEDDVAALRGDPHAARGRPVQFGGL
ncbi:hypothetical protein [Streptomyces albogriseolus]|uniref:hypothetical protein n=1 Tax=Streptomyces albogriseolus TaxID=1887 RepID=UPI003CF4DE6D